MIFETRRIVEPRFLRFSAVKTLFAVVFENLVAFIAEKAYTSTYCAHFGRNACNYIIFVFRRKNEFCLGEQILSRIVNEARIKNKAVVRARGLWERCVS